jgi:hypothetical protein
MMVENGVTIFQVQIEFTIIHLTIKKILLYLVHFVIFVCSISFQKNNVDYVMD